MLLKEYLENLQKVTEEKITYEDVARVLGLGSKQAVSNRIQRKQELKGYEITALDNAFKTNNSNIQNEIIADYYEDVFGSCGSGAFVFSETKNKISIPRECFETYSPVKKYSVINAIGDSMCPYIHEKDKLIVEHWQGEQILDNHIYVFRIGDNIFVKRLVLNINQLIIKSDNEIYPMRLIDLKELEDFQIIGQIVGLMRNMK